MLAIIDYRWDYYNKLRLHSHCPPRAAYIGEGGSWENCSRVERPSARQPTYESGQLTLSGIHGPRLQLARMHTHSRPIFLSPAAQHDHRGAVTHEGQSRSGEKETHHDLRAYISTPRSKLKSGIGERSARASFKISPVSWTGCNVKIWNVNKPNVQSALKSVFSISFILDQFGRKFI